MLDFLGIGAQKAATTWLFVILEQHNNILFPAIDKSLDHWNKEIRYWNSHRDRGIEWYKSIFEGEDKHKIKGEITPEYATLPREIIKEIHYHFPRVKVLYTLRNPIQRAWSMAIMDLNFANADISNTSDQWFMDHFNRQESLANGDYETCLKNWKGVFPDDQILVLYYENLVENHLGFITQVCDFLEIESDVYKTMNSEKLRKAVWSGGHPVIRSSLIPYLTDLYKNKIELLSDYLEKDLSGWLMEGELLTHV